ncbi:hypothetical protein RI848_005048 [Vibrio parahaemolyticus]|nr:hypothetical protein [Vibrio parahaemolyticus]
MINIDELSKGLEEFTLLHAKKSAAQEIRESFDRYEEMTPQQILEDLKAKNVTISKKYLKTAMYRERKLKR